MNEKRQSTTIVSDNEVKQSVIEKRDGMYVLPIGDAAVVDNASILETKLQKIDEVRRANVSKELGEYMPALEALRKQFPEIEAPYKRLSELHNLLWDIEDGKRVIEKGKDEEEFIDALMKEDPAVLHKYLVLCRQVSKYNDERASLKALINKITGSKIVEVKSHVTVS
ncbi:MAG: hypothetical protein NTV03_03575 [Candidatus Nomurabacteria bacterium]|nr:hypothetical protein [Candidatus Nomurabacteria bacterium]